MKAYVVIQGTIKDEEEARHVSHRRRRNIAAARRPLHRARGQLTVVEGEWPHPKPVVIECPSLQAAEEWYRSPAYRKLLPLRLGSSVGSFVIVDGSD